VGTTGVVSDPRHLLGEHARFRPTRRRHYPPLLETPNPADSPEASDDVEQLVDAMPDRYKAMVLVGAYAGLRWGEAAGLTRASIDVLRSRIAVASTAVEVRGHVTLGHEPKLPAPSALFRWRGR
jgi:integrase